MSRLFDIVKPAKPFCQKDFQQLAVISELVLQTEAVEIIGNPNIGKPTGMQ